MATRKSVRLAILALAGLLPAACATTSYSRSGVVAVPPGVKGKAGSSATVQIEGLKVRLESLDYAKREDPIPSLGLLLEFDPRELGYSFDPAQVVLRDESGASWSPRGCVPGSSSYQALVPGSSIVLAFDAVLGPDARLELVLGGLARGRQRLDPVTLPLARRKGRSIDRVYWLEVLLAPFILVSPGG